MTIKEVQQIVDDYLVLFPEEASVIRRLQERLDVDEIFNNRKSFQGHGTGGAIVLSPDKKKILLVHNLDLDIWLQPGGHWDPEDPNPWAVAQREALEETGVQLALYIPVMQGKPHVPVDIGVHDIPASLRKQEPPHVHYDFRYIFQAASEEVAAKTDEVTKLAWVPLKISDKRLREVRPSILKMRQLHII